MMIEIADRHCLKDLTANIQVNHRTIAPHAALIIPTCNGATYWPRLYGGIMMQETVPLHMIVVDSSSTDDTAKIARDLGFEVTIIPRREFNHGSTRQFAVGLAPEASILIYLTQDAVPSDPHTFKNMLAAFDDPRIGAAYGRQLPRPGAGPLETHARLFNYPAESAVRCLDDRTTLGFKTVYASNSFAAYRRQALEEVGGFPANVIVSEETIVFAHMQMAGWKTAYVADAAVLHSHRYTLRQELSRYFDIGVAYSRERWIYDTFRAPNGEGLRFILSELKYLFPRHIHLIPSSLLHTLAKTVGYNLGCSEALLPQTLKRYISAQKNFWVPHVNS